MNDKELPVWISGALLPLMNLLSAMVVAGIVIRLIGEDPFESIAILANSALFNAEGFGYTLFNASTFIFTGLAVSIALEAGLFNIGAEGQMYVGGLGVACAALALDHHLPAPLMIPVAMAGAALFGAAWAFLPGYLQAKRGSHVVVTTIMFNFIAASLMNYMITTWLLPTGQQNPASRVFEETAWLPRLNQWIPAIGESPLNISFILALLALVAYGLIMSRTAWGYEVRAAGLNRRAAHYAGVAIPRTIIVVMLISGALAGFASINSILGSSHYLHLNFPEGAGFMGIAIALMGRRHPIGILLASLLFGALIQGGLDLSMEKQNIPQETFIFIQGLIILFCGAMENLYVPFVSRIYQRFQRQGAAA